jgi:hypothetical protein
LSLSASTVFDPSHARASRVGFRLQATAGREVPANDQLSLNEIARNERLFRCCQRSIVIRAARSPERAVEAAKKRFARLEGIRDWKIHAGLVELELIEPEFRQQTPLSLIRDA